MIAAFRDDFFPRQGRVIESPAKAESPLTCARIEGPSSFANSREVSADLRQLLYIRLVEELTSFAEIRINFFASLEKERFHLLVDCEVSVKVHNGAAVASTGINLEGEALTGVQKHTFLLAGINPSTLVNERKSGMKGIRALF